MTDNKLTDEQIIELLEGCAYPKGNCEGCPYGKCLDERGYRIKTIEHARDLINRQKAEIIARTEEYNDMLEQRNKCEEEIERLKKAIKVQDIMIEQQDYKLKQAKSEAMHELTKEIINNILPQYMYGHEETALRIGFAISEKVKEMVGENK